MISKTLVKLYTREVLIAGGQLTQQLYDLINAGDVPTIRNVLEKRRDAINAQAVSATDNASTMSEAASVQEVIDALPSIFAAQRWTVCAEPSKETLPLV